MKTKMIELIKSAYNDDSKLKLIENLYELYDQLQYSSNINEMAEDLFSWLSVKYKVTNMNFSLFDMEKESATPIKIIGEEFYLDGELSFYFIINTHTHINAVVSFAATNKEHFDLINNDYSYIEAAFFQISPILQNGIMKKQHIEAYSVDSVTNVYNRKYLIEHINRIISLSNENENNITFMMIGIDHFKAVTDEFDYDIGDKVLVELAKVIHSNIKERDIVSRLTGDEFLVALVNVPDISIVELIAQKIIDSFAKVEVVVNEQTNQILKKTICIGISSYPNDNEDIDQVLKYADNFLYEAKNKGRSSYAIYTKEEESSIDLF